MPNDFDVLFIWLFAVIALGALASLVQAYNEPEAREARAYSRAVRLAQEQPERRRRRMQHIPQ